MFWVNAIFTVFALGMIGFFFHTAFGWKGEKWKKHMANPYMRGSTIDLACATVLVAITLLNGWTLNSGAVSGLIILAWIWLMITGQAISAEEGTLVRVHQLLLKRIKDVSFEDHDGKRKTKEGVDLAKVIMDSVEDVLDMKPVTRPLTIFSTKRGLKLDGTLKDDEKAEDELKEEVKE